MRGPLRGVLSSLLVGLAACAPSALDEEPRAGVLRQAAADVIGAGPDFPVMTSASRMGQALGPCGAGYLASDSFGVLQRWPSDAGPSSAASPEFARAVGCSIAVTNGVTIARELAVGAAGLNERTSAGWQQLIPNLDFGSLSVPNPDLGLPLVAGELNGRVRSITLSPIEQRVFIDGGSPLVTPALAWHPQLPVLAVGQPATNQLTIWGYVDGGFALRKTVLASAMTPEFGRALAWGDVSPEPGLELIVGAAGAAVVLETNTYSSVRVLSPSVPSSTFGAAVAVQPSSGFGSLGYAWVGDPSNSTVYRFLGSSQVNAYVTQSMLLDSLGATLVSWSPTAISAGAPDYNSGQGAVFTHQETVVPSQGTVGACTPMTPCYDVACNPGTCLGDVFCKTSGDGGTRCNAGLTCTISGACVFAPDAGRPDGGTATNDGGMVTVDAGLILDGGGGTVDGGSSIDGGSGIDGGTGMVDAGGVIDAGINDGGASDAGTDLDAGAQADAGLEARDAGSALDAGTGADGGVTEPVVFQSCSCSGGPMAPLLLVGFALLRRRRG